MRGPVITVDVSKGICHYQPFLEKGKPFRKPKVLHDTIEGFEDLNAAIEKTKEKSGEDVVPVVFEATGVYHRPLQKYLDDHDMPYYIISPLLSAAYRKTNLHGNKTDALDCSHIAKAYYDEDSLLPYHKQSDLFVKLQKLNRYYETELCHLKKRKVTFRSYLDIIYPRLDKCFKGRSSLYDPVPMEILKKYPHPALLLKHREETIVKATEKKTDHKPAFIQEIVHKMYECAQRSYSGADVNDLEVIKLPQMIEELQEQILLCDSILQELIQEARKVSYFPCIVSIVGIGENLAARLIAELGDMFELNENGDYSLEKNEEFYKIADVFDVLNKNQISYLVLRNYENLLKPEMYLDGHGDLDLLCEDSQEIVRLLDAKTDRKDQYPYKGDGIHYYIYVGGERVSLDLRSVGDGYYCEMWEVNLLKNKVFYNGFFFLFEEAYFYTLIYHAILQKPALSEEYMLRLSEMAQRQGIIVSNYSENGFISILEKYMRKEGYTYTYPVDYMVPARFQLVSRDMIFINWDRWLRHQLFWSKIRVIEMLVWVKHKLQGYK